VHKVGSAALQFKQLQSVDMAMPVPTYDKFIEPLLRYLVSHPEGVPARDAQEAAATALGLSDSAREETLPSGSQLVYKNRIGWAHDRLKRAGYSSSPRRGYWQPTPAGIGLIAATKEALSQAAIEDIATGHDDVRLRQSVDQIELVDAPTLNAAVLAASPDDRLELAISELRAKARSDLQETLAQVSPKFFETIVLDLLHKMGYGTSRGDLQRVGGSGDGGIDGIISLDRLGLEKVYVQAKRWQNSVGRPEVQAFYGALAGHRATKGVFISTAQFTQQAVEFAKSVERIVLVNGEKLADLMIDNEVGITMRPVRVPKLDSDYFEEQ
jgi:restriction system protein